MKRYEDFRRMRQLESYRMNIKGKKEKVRQPLYDYQDYPVGGILQMLFLQTPKGQGVTSHPLAAGTKTIADTNMEAGGQMPSPKLFLAESIEIHFHPIPEATAREVIVQFATGFAKTEFADDVYEISKGGSLRFHVGSKTNVEMAPLGYFPPRVFLDGMLAGSIDLATAVDQHMTMEYATMAGRPFMLDPPVLLEPNQNFHIELNWPNLIPVSVAARIGIVLDGIQMRNPQ